MQVPVAGGSYFIGSGFVLVVVHVFHNPYAFFLHQVEGSGFLVFLFLQCGNLPVQLLAHHLADLLVGSVGVVQIHGSGKEIFETGHEGVAHLVGGDIYFYRGLVAVNLFLPDFVFEID